MVTRLGQFNKSCHHFKSDVSVAAVTAVAKQEKNVFEEVMLSF